MRGRVLQNGHSGCAFCEGLAIDTAAVGFSWKEESLSDILLVDTQHMNGCEPATGKTSEDVAAGSNRRHDQRRFERRLRNPCYRGGSVMIPTSRGDHVHAIGQ